MAVLKFRDDINALRAFSVALVIAFHFQLPGLQGGFLGVDLFFVISGYLMTAILLRQLDGGGIRYGSFVWARVKRIVPALLLMTAVILAIGTVVLAPLDARALGDEALRAITFSSNFHYQQQDGYFRVRDLNDWLLHTWSLSVEWQFYLLYPALFMFVQRLVRRHVHDAGGAAPASLAARRRQALLALFAVLAVASFGANLWAVSSGKVSSAFYLLPHRAWEMLAGGLVVLIPLPRALAVHRRWVAAAGWLTVLVAIALTAHYDWAWRWPGRFAALPVLGAALVIWADTSGLALYAARPVATLGRWSYSLYLWHWPLVVWLTYSSQQHQLKVMQTLPWILLTGVLGASSFRWVDRAFSAGSGWAVRRGTAIALAVAFVLVAAGGWAVVQSNGAEAMAAGNAPVYRSLRVAVDTPWSPLRCRNEERLAPPFELCSIERSGARRILVIGDSFALHLYPWFDAHTDVSIDVLTRVGCPVVRGFRTRASAVCADFADAAWARAALPVYDTVVVASNWAATHARSGGPGGLCAVQPNGSCVTVDQLTDPQTAARSLEASIEPLLAEGKRVIAVQGHQRPEQHVPLALSRQLEREGALTLRIDAQHDLYKNEHIDALFARLAARDNFFVVSFRNEVCARGECPLYDLELNAPVYSDDSHFDQRWLQRHGDALKRFVAAPPAPVSVAKTSASPRE